LKSCIVTVDKSQAVAEETAVVDSSWPVQPPQKLASTIVLDEVKTENLSILMHPAATQEYVYCDTNTGTGVATAINGVQPPKN
jgi:hypothetical protein